MPQREGTQSRARSSTRPARLPSTASAAHPALRRSKHEVKQTERCPYCGAHDIIKKGVRKNKYGAVQLFYCGRCAKKFSPLSTKGKSFPLKIILAA